VIRRALILAIALAVLGAADPRADEAAAPFRMAYIAKAHSARPNKLVLKSVLIADLARGERVRLYCYGCGGRHIPETERVATGSRMTFPAPGVIVTKRSRLAVEVSGGLFRRWRNYWVRPRTASLKLYVENCFNLATYAQVPCTQQFDSDVWATITTCRAGAAGITAHVPTPARGIAVYAQYGLIHPSGAHWADQASTDFLPFGTGTYVFSLPGVSGNRFRGWVHFQWREGNKVVAEAWRGTEAGHAVDPAASDPPGLSDVKCDL
jgi:hypothetical protein